MVLIIGDLHGNFKHLRYILQHRDLKNCTLIQVGDFGIGYHPSMDQKILSDLNDFLAERNSRLLVIRGNHDDPEYFDGTYQYSNLKLMEDYSTEVIENKKFLFCGGALSIDRLDSLERMQLSASFGLNEPMYWEKEAFIYDEKKAEELRDIDIVITHTAPEWCYPVNANGFGRFVESFIERDQDLRQDLLDERNKLSRLFETLKKNDNPVQLHFYGHFHSTAKTSWHDTNHYLVNIGQALDLDKYLPDGNYLF